MRAGSTIYDLFAVCNHFGHANFGHYTAFVRGGEWADRAGGAGSGVAAGSPGSAAASANTPELPDEWFNFNDDRVTPVPRERVVSHAAYVLFYRRRASGSGSRS